MTDTAACAGHPDPDLWFGQHSWRQAVAVCETCPIRVACLEGAIARELDDYLGAYERDGRGAELRCYGVWGGLTGPQRKRLIATRHRRRIAAATRWNGTVRSTGRAPDGERRRDENPTAVSA